MWGKVEQARQLPYRASHMYERFKGTLFAPDIIERFYGILMLHPIPTAPNQYPKMSGYLARLGCCPFAMTPRALEQY